MHSAYCAMLGMFVISIFCNSNSDLNEVFKFMLLYIMLFWDLNFEVDISMWFIL